MTAILRLDQKGGKMEEIKQKKVKLSIIVPVYNVERYLDRCIDSLLKQDIEDYEIILIDDESTDLSGQKCDTWAQKDDRIRVIHKKNAGAGFARNTGVEVAKGQYLAYVDSDDYVKEGAFKKIIFNMDKSGADACYFGYYDVFLNGKQEQVSFPPKKLQYSGEEKYEFAKYIISSKPESTQVKFCGGYPWSGIVRKELVDRHRIWFPSEKIVMNEDLFFNLEIVLHSEKIIIIPDYYYYYCHNENSLTISYQKDRFQNAKNTYKTMVEKFSNYIKHDIDFYQRIERLFLSNLISCLKQEYTYNRYKKKIISKICSDSTVVDVINSYPVERMPFKQRILFNAIKDRKILLIIFLLWLKNKMNTVVM